MLADHVIDSHQHFWQVGGFDYPWMNREVEVLYRDYLPTDLEPVLAECDLQMVKLQQKISGCFRTSDGARVLRRKLGSGLV